MQQTTPSFLQKVLFIVGIAALLGLSTQWFTINWGRVENAQTPTINVSGEAKDLHANQIATFTAGVSVTDPDRETAVEMASTQMTELVDAVKAFGILTEDIKTESVSVYEYTIPEADASRTMGMTAILPAPPTRGEQTWQASSSISITLRDISQATELTNLLARLDAVNISGPNFTTDDTTALDDRLLQEAMADARRKADLLLEGTGQKVIGVVNVFENDNSYPYFARDMAMSAVGSAAPMPVEPGSQTIYKTVSVTFEISR